jgi:hypothetical protein
MESNHVGHFNKDPLGSLSMREIFRRKCVTYPRDSGDCAEMIPMRMCADTSEAKT